MPTKEEELARAETLLDLARQRYWAAKNEEDKVGDALEAVNKEVDQIYHRGGSHDLLKELGDRYRVLADRYGRLHEKAERLREAAIKALVRRNRIFDSQRGAFGPEAQRHAGFFGSLGGSGATAGDLFGGGFGGFGKENNPFGSGGGAGKGGGGSVSAYSNGVGSASSSGGGGFGSGSPGYGDFGFGGGGGSADPGGDGDSSAVEAAVTGGSGGGGGGSGHTGLGQHWLGGNRNAPAGRSSPGAKEGTPSGGHKNSQNSDRKSSEEQKKTGGGSGHMPNPNSTTGGGFSGISFLDDMMFRQLRLQGRFIGGPLGPSRALRPDVESSSGAVGISLDFEMLDPIAPVAGGEHYEPRRPRGRMGGGAAAANPNPYTEALYPDSGDDDTSGGSEATIIKKFVGDRPRAPGDPEGGSPEAFGGGTGTVVAISPGVGAGSRTPTS